MTPRDRSKTLEGATDADLRAELRYRARQRAKPARPKKQGRPPNTELRGSIVRVVAGWDGEHGPTSSEIAKAVGRNLPAVRYQCKQLESIGVLEGEHFGVGVASMWRLGDRHLAYLQENS